MEKKTMADKLAQKTFHSAAFQKSWAVHMHAFGPILAPAFANHYQARILLTDALNKISRRECKDGRKKLEQLQEFCVCDADKAAWLFCMGICAEMEGSQECIAYYRQAGTFGHRFYLPYLKIAKRAHTDAAFDMAEENYRAAIGCLDPTNANDQIKAIAASAYTNLASCLTMMHRFQEAKEALDASAFLLPIYPARSTAEAILYAAMGERGKTEELIAELKAEMPQFADPTEKMAFEILDGKHPHFYEISIKMQMIAEFWNWFLQNECIMLQKLAADEYDSVFTILQVHIAPVFPFLKRKPELQILKKQDSVEITLADFYMVSLENGYRQLINACPAELRSRWEFNIAH